MPKLDRPRKTLRESLAAIAKPRRAVREALAACLAREADKKPR